jgi:hypothetical protein
VCENPCGQETVYGKIDSVLPITLHIGIISKQVESGAIGNIVGYLP